WLPSPPPTPRSPCARSPAVGGRCSEASIPTTPTPRRACTGSGPTGDPPSRRRVRRQASWRSPGHRSSGCCTASGRACRRTRRPWAARSRRRSTASRRRRLSSRPRWRASPPATSTARPSSAVARSTCGRWSPTRSSRWPTGSGRPTGPCTAAR
ncbi:MAG: hypothetical protein AVDCRST_MAG20-1955, partial [uncultured Acidimicrobiales bacterium]